MVGITCFTGNLLHKLFREFKPSLFKFYCKGFFNRIHNVIGMAIRLCKEKRLGNILPIANRIIAQSLWIKRCIDCLLIRIHHKLNLCRIHDTTV